MNTNREILSFLVVIVCVWVCWRLAELGYSFSHLPIFYPLVGLWVEVLETALLP
jgi:hypothetical protein